MASIIRGNDNFDSSDVGPSTAVGAVGTYYVGGILGPNLSSGVTVAGSNIWDQGLSNSYQRLPFTPSYGYSTNGTQTQTSLSGTWRMMNGPIRSGGSGIITGTLLVRIS